jgi:putative membrane protein
MGLLLRFVFGVAGLWLAARLVHGITYAGLDSLVAAALILGIINAVLRPVLVLLTLPLTILSLGLFLLVINAGMLELTSMFLRGFHVHSFVAALFGSIVVSVVSWIGHMIVGR